MTEKQLFRAKNDLLRGTFPEVSTFDFYRDLFPEGSLGTPGDLDSRKPNMIVSTCFRKTDEEIAALKAKEEEEARIYEEQRNSSQGWIPRPKRYKRRRVSNRLVFDDLAELSDLVTATDPLLEFVIIAPVAFSGKNRTKANAYHLWGFCIDLDGVEMDQLVDLLYQIEGEVIPQPTYIANSGHGMHLYYCFEDPVPLYPHMMEPLQALKNALTDCVWNYYTSTIPTEQRQYQSLVQGYRAVGSVSKLGKNYRVTAFRTGEKRTLSYLQDWADETGRLSYDEFNHVTLDEAREKWPEWYKWRIEEGQSRRPFKFKHRRVYDSWLQRMKHGAFEGNRYNCIAVLFALAYKTEGMTYEEVLDDAMELVPRLDQLTKTKNNAFTVDDVLDAAAYYDEPSQSLGLKSVYRMTKIYIQPAKRNHRSQHEHLGRVRALQNFDDPEGSWRYRGGAPEKKELVAAFRAEHPEASVTEVARALQISRTTVYKWWGGQPETAPVSDKPEEPGMYQYTPRGIERVDPKKGVRRIHSSEELKKVREYINWKKP